MTSTSPILALCVCGNPNCKISSGLCHCGCGGKTQINGENVSTRGLVKGCPKIFIKGHHAFKARPVIEDAVPFKIAGDYCRLISLSRNCYAIVLETDYRWLMRWWWYAYWNPKTGKFYAERTEKVNGKKRTIRMSRVVLGMSFEDEREADHVDPLATTDNRPANLRIATHQENSHNLPLRRTNKSGYKGVCWEKRRKTYKSEIKLNGKTKYLGSDPDPAVCHELYKAAAIEHYGKFARFE